MKFYLIFTKGMNGLLDRMLGTDLGHIIILKDDGERMWLINPKGHRCEITSITNDPARIIEAIDVDHLLCIETKDVENKRILSILTPFTCVKFVKYLLGIKVFALTPNQLYRKLKKEISNRWEGKPSRLSNLIKGAVIC